MLIKNLQSKKVWHCLFIVLLCIAVYVLFRNAWVVDDAYITFRTVDNFVNGYGLTWNVGERVQVYTHPLWMFAVSLIYTVTSDVFYSSIVLCFVFAFSSVLLASYSVTDGFRNCLWKPSLFVIAFLSSKAVIDYASSGLENPLSYFIAALFFAKFLSVSNGNTSKHITEKDLGIFFFIASLAFFNRMDTILIYFPALIYLLYISRSLSKRRLIVVIVIATLPATLWILFSLVYYGYPFPNTAYAKVLCPEFPRSWKIRIGLNHLASSFHWDTASYFVVGAALFWSLKKRSVNIIAPMTGVLLYMLFTVFSAASATHMNGRFFALPFFVSMLIFIYKTDNVRLAAIVGVALIVYTAWSPVSAIKFGTKAYHPYPDTASSIDTKHYVLDEGAALINWKSGRTLPDHGWYHYGEALKKTSGKVHIGGAFGGDAIGYAGYAAGPGKYILDWVALSCPLLSRLPANQPEDVSYWRPGHFQRFIPKGYAESIATGRNMIHDDSLREYYEVILSITRGPIFTIDRFLHIWNMNLGRYDHLVEGYAKHGTDKDK
ncbi:MAG: hypothetical protein GY795_26510 [Desulfobacterales bacterium]|nr:hypothetical protein [Desulfobacterales bacterium]